MKEAGDAGDWVCNGPKKKSKGRRMTAGLGPEIEGPKSKRSFRGTGYGKRESAGYWRIVAKEETYA